MSLEFPSATFDNQILKVKNSWHEICWCLVKKITQKKSEIGTFIASTQLLLPYVSRVGRNHQHFNTHLSGNTHGWDGVSPV